ncbi:MAG: SPW repeat protein [Parcubacteria group bacterium]|jgi:hypothetical protein
MNEKEQKMKTASWLIVLTGIWLILAPFILGFSGTILSRSDVVAGIAIIVISIVRIGMPEDGTWIDWLSALLGIWVLLTPFMFQVPEMAGFWNNFIFGLATIGLSVWASLSEFSANKPETV